MAKTIVAVIFGIILAAFLGLSVYSGVTGNSYKEIFTVEEETVEDGTETTVVGNADETELLISVAK